MVEVLYYPRLSEERFSAARDRKRKSDTVQNVIFEIQSVKAPARSVYQTEILLATSLS